MSSDPNDVPGDVSGGATTDVGSWCKRHAPSNPLKAQLDSVVHVQRAEMDHKFQMGLEQGWGKSQRDALHMPLTRAACVRVVVLRHGMGYHNDLGGGLSFFNRDASLNGIGVTQAQSVGQLLRASGLLTSPSLRLVVSPFRRTLETAVGIMGSKVWSAHTVIQPLAAEHTLERSRMQQGDRGSTAQHLRTLFPSQEYPQYDFTSLEAYCKACGVTEPGKWWHHGPGTSETRASFAARAVALRQWLVSQASARAQAKETAMPSGQSRERVTGLVETVLVIAHGGILTAAFDKESYGNCEFRCFDLMPDASFVRLAANPQLPETIGVTTLPKRVESVGTPGAVLTIDGVERQDKLYLVRGTVAGQPLHSSFRLSQLRTGIHAPVKAALSAQQYGRYWAVSFPGSSVVWRNLEPWLRCLGRATQDKDFPASLTQLVIVFFTQ